MTERDQIIEQILAAIPGLSALLALGVIVVGARRAEAETDRLHRWIDQGCPPPPPARPWWSPPAPYRKDSPWET